MAEYKVGDKVKINYGGHRGETATVVTVVDNDGGVDLELGNRLSPLRYALYEIEPVSPVSGLSDQPYEVVIPVGTKFGAEQVLRLLVQDNPGIEAHVRKAV
jgi:hypothetical protein